MKNLTIKQKQLVTEIISQFENMNETPTKSSLGGLINMSEIKQTINDNNRIREEVKLIDKANRQVAIEFINSHIDRLNVDLIPNGIIAKFSDRGDLHIRISEIKNPDLNVIGINYNYEYKTVLIEGEASQRYLDTFKSVSGYFHSSHNETYFSSIEELTSNKIFISQIKKLL